MESETPAFDLTIALPEEWTVHAPGEWSRLADVTAVNPVLRGALRAMGDRDARPDLVASLLLEIRSDEDELLTVLMASLVVYCLAEPGVRAERLRPSLRRQVPVVDDVKADFYELPVFVTDSASGLSALATFTTPNLPLIGELEPGFRSIAESIAFVSRRADVA